MPSTYSSSLRIELVADNEQAGIWGQTTNRNFTQVFEEALTQTAEVDVTAGDVTLTAINGASDQARRPFIRVIGAPVVARQVNVPDVTKLYIVQNTTGQSLTVKPSGQTGVTLLAGQVGYVRCRTGLSAQVIEFLATTNGNLVVPGTLTVNGTSTFNNVATITAAGTQLVLRSGAAGAAAAINIGRTGTEGYFGVSAGPGTFSSADVAGDMTVRSEQRLWLTVGASGYVRIDGATGVTSFQGFTASGSILPVVPVRTGIRIGEAGSPIIQWNNLAAGADNKNWDIYASPSSLVFRAVNDAYNVAPVWLVVDRSGTTITDISFPLGNFGIGGTAPGVGGTAPILNIYHPSQQPALTIHNATGGNTASRGFMLRQNAARTEIINFENGGIYLSSNNGGAGSVIVDSAGNLGVGVGPTCKLDVFGNFIKIGDGSFAGFFGRGTDLVIGGTAAQTAIRSNNGDLLFTASASGATQLRLDTVGRLASSTMHNNASGPGTNVLGYVLSGTYTPTLSSGTNVTSASAASPWNYIRVGNIVHVTGHMNVISPATGSALVVASLPVASNLSVNTRCAGVASNYSGNYSGGQIVGSSGTNQAHIQTTTAVSGTAVGWVVTFSYEVV